MAVNLIVTGVQYYFAALLGNAYNYLTPLGKHCIIINTYIKEQKQVARFPCFYLHANGLF
jgi:hypothetical protein